MTDYTKLIEALRCDFGECPDECIYNISGEDCEAPECPYNYKTQGKNLDADAAAAIEALQAEVPKRGEWIKHPEVKNIYGGEFIECPFCGEKYVVQYIADEKFCRNCGADMRAKMEVQE